MKEEEESDDDGDGDEDKNNNKKTPLCGSYSVLSTVLRNRFIVKATL